MVKGQIGLLFVNLKLNIMKKKEKLKQNNIEVVEAQFGKYSFNGLTPISPINESTDRTHTYSYYGSHAGQHDWNWGPCAKWHGNYMADVEWHDGTFSYFLLWL